MKGRTRLAVILAVSMMGGGTAPIACTPSPAPSKSAPTPAAAAGMTLEVENHNVLDVRVFLLRDGQRQKIGTVPSMTKQTFRVTAAELGGANELRLLANLIGSHDAFSSEPIPIQAGATIEWQVEKDIRFSSVLLR